MVVAINCNSLDIFLELANDTPFFALFWPRGILWVAIQEESFHIRFPPRILKRQIETSLRIQWVATHQSVIVRESSKGHLWRKRRFLLLTSCFTYRGSFEWGPSFYHVFLCCASTDDVSIRHAFAEVNLHWWQVYSETSDWPLKHYLSLSLEIRSGKQERTQ